MNIKNTNYSTTFLRYASWEMLSMCNLSCAFCYAKVFQDGRAGAFGKLRQVVSVEDFTTGLHHLCEQGLQLINIEGGEPTLLPNLAEYICKAKQFGLKVVLSTHGGYLLSSQKSGDTLLEELVVAGLDTLSLSFHGAKAETVNSIMRNAAGGSSGHYQKVMELLQALEQFPTLLEVKVNMVVTSQNVSEMADMVRLLGTFKRNFQLKLVECLPRGQGTKEMMPVHDDFLQGVAAAIMATEKYPNVSVVSRTYEGDESFYPFVVFSPTGSCMIPEGQKQETVTDDDGVISILQAGGVDRLIVHIKNKYGERFDNDQINTYKSS